MATTTIEQVELRIYLNNGTSATGTVKTNNLKIADMQDVAVTDSIATAVDAITAALSPLFSKSIYETAITTKAQVHN